MMEKVIVEHVTDIKSRVAAILLPVCVVIQIIALGVNGPLLSAAGSFMTIAICLTTQLLLRPSPAFWKGAAWVIICYLLILAWIAGPAVFSCVMPVRAALQIVPDLLNLGICHLLGLLAGLLTAAMIGYRRGLFRLSIDALLLLSIGHIILALMMRSADPGHVWGIDKGLLLNRFTGTFLNANASGALFGALSILAMGRWLGLLRASSPLTATPMEMIRHLTCAIALILGVGACVITQSRASLVLTLVMLGATIATDHEIHRLLKQRAGKIVLSLMAIVALLALLMLSGDVSDRFYTLNSDSVDRITIWRHYLHLALPVGDGGYGLLSFAELNARTMSDPAEAAMFWYINAPHNIILSLLMEGGWPYLILWTILFAIISFQILTAQMNRVRQDPLLRAIQASCLLILSSAMVDITLDVPAMAMLAMMLVGLCWGRAIRNDFKRATLSLLEHPSSASVKSV